MPKLETQSTGGYDPSADRTPQTAYGRGVVKPKPKAKKKPAAKKKK